MYKGVLPVLLVLTILSCNKPAAESSSGSDTSAVSDLPPEEDPTNDTAYNGNTDGDFFMPEADSSEAQQEADADENRFVTLNSSELDIVGFDSNGNNFVFTQLVPGDNGGGTGHVYVLDAAKNEWATKPTILERTDNAIEIDEIREELKKKRDSVLKKINFKPSNVSKSVDLTTGEFAVVNDKSYAVELTVDNLMIELRLKGSGKNILLQKDKKVPASRGSVREYRLHKAVTSGDKIAVFIEYDGEIQEGFENMRYYDRKYIAVTGVVE